MSRHALRLITQDGDGNGARVEALTQSAPLIPPRLQFWQIRGAVCFKQSRLQALARGWQGLWAFELLQEPVDYVALADSFVVRVCKQRVERKKRLGIVVSDFLKGGQLSIEGSFVERCG